MNSKPQTQRKGASDAGGAAPRTGGGKTESKPSQKIPVQDISSKGALNKTPSSSRKSLKNISGALVTSSQAKSVQEARSAAETSTMNNQVRVAELQNYVVNKIEMLKKTQANIKKLTQLAAFIPDFILKEETFRKVPYQRSTDGNFSSLLN